MNILTSHFPVDLINIIVDYADEIKMMQQKKKILALNDISQLRYMQSTTCLRRPNENPTILQVARLRKIHGYCRKCNFILLIPENATDITCECYAWCESWELQEIRYDMRCGS
jgi:hypothetical protein